jgi:hypothetical protein
MAEKSILRVQVSLRRVVDFNEESPAAEDKVRSSEKAEQDAKASKVQASN